MSARLSQLHACLIVPPGRGAVLQPIHDVRRKATGHLPQRGLTEQSPTSRPRLHPRAVHDGYRSLGFGKELARHRHALCRGAAPLHRDLQSLRPAVHRPHARSEGGEGHRHSPGDRHRAHQYGAHAPLHRRHAHGPQRPLQGTLCQPRVTFLRTLRTSGAPTRPGSDLERP